MTLGMNTCTMYSVAETGRRLSVAGDRRGLGDFTRAILSCPRLRACDYGDYCTIFAASLLSEQGKTHHPDGEDTP